MTWVAFFAGLFLGGMVGLFTMCLCVISGDESRREELREMKDADLNQSVSTKD